MKISIAILTCWYGPYPWYFPYFLHSCSFNTSIDFIIITDNKEGINNLPLNVKIHQLSLNQLSSCASERLGFPVDINYPYKLTDFKPTYGFLFPELVKGYDFWGHGDIDLVYGDIRGFMTSEILNNYDVISSRHDYITGSFCLFRNCNHINELFMRSKDYKKVLSNSQHYCFDECNFLFSELEKGATIFDFPDNIQSMTYVVQKEALDGKLKVLFDFIILEGVPGNIKWERGKIIYKNVYEAMYYHLVLFKFKCRPMKINNPIPETFYFTPTKIVLKY